MKNYPQPIQVRQELNLKQGIKSSLPELPKLFAITMALYLASDEQAELTYSTENGQKLILSKSLEVKILHLFAAQLSNYSSTQFIEQINQTPLFTAQLEALQVTIELFWKLGQINFVNQNFPNSQERTGGSRYEKVIHFSTNCNLVSLCFSDNTTDFKDILFEWITNTGTFKNEAIENKIKEVLTIFTEEAQFKIRTENGSELFFQQEGIYNSLNNVVDVDIKDEHEPVGPFRIYKSFLKSGLHAYLYESANHIVSVKQKKSISLLQKYSQKVSTFLNLQAKKIIITENGNIDTQILPKFSTIKPLQKILFGAPGTGKSHQIKALRKEFGAKEFKTVFHPDSDYSTFVGAYKPMMQGDNVRYAFVPQVFTKAYTHAWNNPEELVLLTIEEINRGNCAQIFGDLFQCLDRNANGMSEYAIDAEYDLAEYLKETLDNQGIINSIFQENYKVENAYSKIALPHNLLIYATMNTSDQSLFPMDSAFKRRWDWEYVPINYEEAAKMTIQLDETTTYNWGDFIKKINKKIYEITQSEDKQLGNFFVKTAENEAISLDVFRSKVMFYLWSEIFKEENDSDTIFKYSESDGHKTFTFNQLYNEDVVEILKGFMRYNNVSLNI